MKLTQPTILAIDSAIGISSVAVWHDGKVGVYLEDRESSMQSARLMPLVEKALKQANIHYCDLTHVAATVGPGSFTGIRIGLAAARGIAFAAGIPCLGFTTLEVMHAAFCHPRDCGDPVSLSILNAGKGEVFYQVFGPQNTPPAIGILREVLARYPSAKIACSVSLPKGYSTTITHPRADALATLAATKKGEALPPSPFYIRPPDAKPANKVS